MKKAPTWEKMNMIIPCILLFLTIVCYVIFFKQDRYVLIPIADWWKHLTSNIKEFPSMMFNLYFLFLVTFIGTSFTVLSIFLSRKNIPFTSFFKYLSFVDFGNRLAGAIVLIQCIVILSVAPILRYTYIIDLYIILSIISLIYFFIMMVDAMTYIENKNKCIGLIKRHTIKFLNPENKLYKILEQYIKQYFINKREREKRFIVGLYKNVIAVCFNKDIYSILFSTHKEIKEMNENINYDELYIIYYEVLTSSNLTLSTVDVLIISICKYIYSDIYEILSKNNIQHIKKIYTILFNSYKKYIYTDKVDRSYILEIKEPVYRYIMNNRNTSYDNKKEIYNLYANLMYECKNIIYLSLYHTKYNIVKCQIQDFMSMIQFFDIVPDVDYLIRYHEKYIVDIITLIFNTIRIGRIDTEYLKLIPSLFEHIHHIEILDIEDDYYDEILHPVDFHEPQYTRKFYIALLIVYMGILDSKNIDNIIKKIKYESKEENSRYQGYEYVLTNIKKISKNDISMLGFSDEEYDNTIKEISQNLSDKINAIKKQNLQKLKEKNTSKELREGITTRFDEIKEEFKDFYTPQQDYNDETYISQKIKAELYFSKRVLSGDTSIHFFGSRYYNPVIDFLYHAYLRRAEIIYIDDISEIKGIEEKNTLLLPRDYNSYFYMNPNIEYTGNGIKIDNKEFSFEWRLSNSECIVLKKDLQDWCRLYKLEQLNDIEENEEENDIGMKVPFEMIFKIKKSEPHNAYRIIGR